jgi:hypothetical protein
VTILVPELIYAGDTVVFDVPEFTDSIGTTISSGTYTLKWYARTNTASEGTTITAAAESTGWRVTVPASTTLAFDAGLWTWQAIASYSTSQYTAGRGQFTVKASAAYTGTPGAFDDRSRAEIDLGYVEAAIRTWRRVVRFRSTQSATATSSVTRCLSCCNCVMCSRLKLTGSEELKRLGRDSATLESLA